MNYHVEIKRLQQRYGTNPETKQCLQDTLHIFRAYTDEILEMFTKAKTKANLPTGETTND